MYSLTKHPGIIIDSSFIVPHNFFPPTIAPVFTNTCLNYSSRLGLRNFQQPHLFLILHTFISFTFPKPRLHLYDFYRTFTLFPYDRNSKIQTLSLVFKVLFVLVSPCMLYPSGFVEKWHFLPLVLSLKFL